VEASQYARESGNDGIRDCIRGIFFFGTPHQGLRIAELRDMVDEESDYHLKIQNLLTQLAEGSEFLENQKEALSQIWHNFSGKVFTFYETEKTGSINKVGIRYSGVLIRVVNVDSWHREFSKEAVMRYKWCRDCRLSFTFQTNVAFQSILITQTWLSSISLRAEHIKQLLHISRSVLVCDQLIELLLRWNKN
jgi:hypothetical protein